MDVDTKPEVARKPKKAFVPKLNKVFIKNLTPETTSEQLEELFGNLAPIRRCFVIQKNGKCTGIGYVHYAVEADAKKAVATLNHKKLNGKTIEVSLARPKNYEELEAAGVSLDTKVAREEAPVPSEKPKSAPVKKVESKEEKKKDEEEKGDEIGTKVDVTKQSVAARTVAISGIPEDIVYKQLVRKVRKFGRIEAMEYPAAEGSGVAYVLYHGADQAAASLNKLSADFSIGSGSSSNNTTIQMFSTTRINRFRVIVRNLPFKCTLELLRTTFAPFGDILQIDLPPGNTPGTIRGFGFITYTNLAAANKAVAEGSKLRLLGRAIAVDLTVGRDQVRREREGHSSAPQVHHDEDEESGDKKSENSMDVDEDDGSASGSRSGDDDDGDEDEDDNKSENGDDEDEKERKSKVDEFDPDDPESWPKEMPEFESEDESDEGDDDDNDKAKKKKSGEEESTKKHLSSDVHLGQTIFLRNVAFDTTEAELFDKFSEWGVLKHAKLVVDRTTGEPRGTAFVHFVKSSDADKCLKDAYRSQKFANNRRGAGKKDPNALVESDIQLGGRHLIVDLAVTKKSADKLTEERKIKREKTDTRNLSLAALSTLTQDQMAELSTQERDKYERGQHEKNTKLANPNFHISRTRLCVRNLPKSMTEDALRSLFAKAAAGIPGHLGFHQVKVVRDPERGNASRGYGFVEFSDHVHAKAALEAIHHKHHKQAAGNRLFVEFAVEDSRVLQAREFKLARSRDNSRRAAQAAKDAAAEQGDGGDNNKKSRNPKKRKRSDDGEAHNGDEGAAASGEKQEGGKFGKSAGGRGDRGKHGKDARKSSSLEDRPSKRPKLGDTPKVPRSNGKFESRRSNEDDGMEMRYERGKSMAPKGKWGAPAESSRRGSQPSHERDHEKALAKMIGEYQKSLDTTPKSRWYQ